MYIAFEVEPVFVQSRLVKDTEINFRPYSDSLGVCTKHQGHTNIYTGKCITLAFYLY